MVGWHLLTTTVEISRASRKRDTIALYRSSSNKLPNKIYTIVGVASKRSLFARRTRTERCDWRSLHRWLSPLETLVAMWTQMAPPSWCPPSCYQHPLRIQGWRGTTSTSRGKIERWFYQLRSIFSWRLSLFRSAVIYHSELFWTLPFLLDHCSYLATKTRNISVFHFYRVWFVSQFKVRGIKVNQPPTMYFTPSYVSLTNWEKIKIKETY